MIKKTYKKPLNVDWVGIARSIYAIAGVEYPTKVEVTTKNPDGFVSLGEGLYIKELKEERSKATIR